MSKDEGRYIPKNVEFKVTNEGFVPDSLGECKNLDAAHEIMKNFIATNSNVSVIRFMDNKEKTDLRKEYQNILEDDIPSQVAKVEKAHSEYLQAKGALKELENILGASKSTAQAIALDVKEGTVEIDLEEIKTFKVAAFNKYYYFTYISGELQLCKIGNIPMHERDEIFSQCEQNEAFLTDNFGPDAK